MKKNIIELNQQQVDVIAGGITGAAVAGVSTQILSAVGVFVGYNKMRIHEFGQYPVLGVSALGWSMLPLARKVGEFGYNVAVSGLGKAWDILKE